MSLKAENSNPSDAGVSKDTHYRGYILRGPSQTEKSRLDKQHEFLRRSIGEYAGDATGRIFLAELGNPKTSHLKMADIGTGSGVWAMEMAQNFPQSTITALDNDLSRIDPDSRRYPNLTIVQDDLLTGLRQIGRDNQFDYTHVRLVLNHLPTDKWTGVIRSLVRVTKDGGQIEIEEPGFIRGGSENFSKMMEAFYTHLIKSGLDFYSGKVKLIEGLLKQNGCEIQTLHVPLPWDREHPEGLDNIFEAMGILTGEIAASNEISPNDFRNLVQQARDEMYDPTKPYAETHTTSIESIFIARVHKTTQS